MTRGQKVSLLEILKRETEKNYNMDTERNVRHRFDLTGLSAGQSFLGCPKCWFRLQPGQAMKPICQCGAPMNLYDVTPADVALRTVPPDLSTPALRNAFCAAHGLPGYLIFSPSEFAQIEIAHSRMKTEITKWRLAADDSFGAKTPEGLKKAKQVHTKRNDDLRHTLMEIIQRTPDGPHKDIARKALNS